VAPKPPAFDKHEAAKAVLSPYITREARGDDEVEVLDVTAALRGGAQQSVLKDVGVGGNELQKAYAELEAQDYGFVPADLAPNKVQPSVVPIPAVKKAPPPGEKFTVPKDIKQAQEKADQAMEFEADIAARGYGMSPTATVAITEQAAVRQAVTAVESGDLTADEARGLIQSVQGQAVSKNLPLSDAAYMVPGLGSFKSYQDAVEAGWSPVSTGMFITSSALDVLLFVSPLKAGQAILRLPKTTGILKATGTYSPKTIPPLPTPRTITKTITETLTPAEKESLKKLLETAAPAKAAPKPVPAPKAAPAPLPTQVKELISPLHRPLTKADVKTTKGVASKAKGLHESLTPGADIELKPMSEKAAREVAEAVAAREARFNTARTGLEAKTSEHLAASETLEDLLNNPLYRRFAPDIVRTREKIADHEDAVIEVQRLITTIQKPDTGLHEVDIVQGWTQINVLLDALGESETRLKTDIEEALKNAEKANEDLIIGAAVEAGVKIEALPDVIAKPEVKTVTEPATKPEVKTVTKPVTKTPTKPVTKTPTKPVTKTPTKPVTKIPTKPVTKIPTRPVTKTPPPTLPPRVPPPKKPLKVPPKLPTFKLPKGKKLPPGFFPRVVTWPQGAVQIAFNLTTGVTTYKARTPDKTRPRDGFRVSQLARTRPTPRVLDMGVTDVLVSSDSIRFKRSRTAAPGRQFQRSGGRL
jgi:hypothetical protein